MPADETANLVADGPLAATDRELAAGAEDVGPSEQPTTGDVPAEPEADLLESTQSDEATHDDADTADLAAAVDVEAQVQVVEDPAIEPPQADIDRMPPGADKVTTVRDLWAQRVKNNPQPLKPAS